jgi:hypothetical protein
MKKSSSFGAKFKVVLSLAPASFVVVVAVVGLLDCIVSTESSLFVKPNDLPVPRWSPRELLFQTGRPALPPVTREQLPLWLGEKLKLPDFDCFCCLSKFSANLQAKRSGTEYFEPKVAQDHKNDF